MTVDNRTGVTHAAGVWLGEEAHEMTVFAEQYDLVLSLLLLGAAPDRVWVRDEEEDPVAVPVDARI